MEIFLCEKLSNVKVNKEKPLVSICIPIFNGSQFLNDALESVQFQTYSNCEVIISDDNSTDNSIEIVQVFSKKCKYPVKLIINDPDKRGIGENWNNSIRNAHGVYIKFLFQDDILREDCIDKMIFQIQQSPSVGFIYCRRDFIYPNGNNYYNNWIHNYGELHKHWNSHYQLNAVIKGTKLLKDINLFSHPQNKFGEPIATLIKREVFESIGLFNTQLKQTLDYEYWNRLLRVTHTMFIDEPLVTFRLHQDQTSSINQNQKLDESELFNKSMYEHVLFCLHWRNMLFLINRYNPFFKKSNESIKYLKKRLRYTLLKTWLLRKI